MSGLLPYNITTRLWNGKVIFYIGGEGVGAAEFLQISINWANSNNWGTFALSCRNSSLSIVNMMTYLICHYHKNPRCML